MRSHEDVNKCSRYYIPYRSSLFFFFGDTPTNEGEPLDVGSRERVFAILPRGEDIANDSWVIICVLPQAKRTHYICTHDPQLSPEEWNSIKLHLNDYSILLDEGMPDPYPFSYFEKCENNFHGSTYVIALIFCIVNEAPISFKPSDASNFRLKIAFWILNSYLPDLR